MDFDYILLEQSRNIFNVLNGKRAEFAFLFQRTLQGPTLRMHVHTILVESFHMLMSVCLELQKLLKIKACKVRTVPTSIRCRINISREVFINSA